MGASESTSTRLRRVPSKTESERSALGALKQALTQLEDQVDANRERRQAVQDAIDARELKRLMPAFPRGVPCCVVADTCCRSPAAVYHTDGAAVWLEN